MLVWNMTHLRTLKECYRSMDYKSLSDMFEKSKFDLVSLTDMAMKKKINVIKYEDILNRIEEAGVEILSVRSFNDESIMFVYFSDTLSVDVRKTEYEDVSFNIINGHHELYWPKSNHQKVFSNKLTKKSSFMRESSRCLLRFDEMLPKIIKLLNA